MGVLRILFWLLIGWLVYRFIRQLVHKPTSRPAPPQPPNIEQMLRCELCGLHVPQSEAIASKGHTYCCDDHRRRAQSTT
ncbi:MAG: hypothetical protein HY080_13100 [Gammaproteobacteria bacterium]|nr:hypothetical protein [Gammaproteobacteria bacterium]